jgi:hypothetical protein
MATRGDIACTISTPLPVNNGRASANQVEIMCDPELTARMDAALKAQAAINHRISIA